MTTRIRCREHRCAFNKRGICTSPEIEYDPDAGCLTMELRESAEAEKEVDPEEMEEELEEEFGDDEDEEEDEDWEDEEGGGGQDAQWSSRRKTGRRR